MIFFIRLDDACEWRDLVKWDHIERILDDAGIKPLVGIIPECKDDVLRRYSCDPDFWARARGWQDKGWVIALHGYNHVFMTACGGINPVNKRSEFAGLSLEIQKMKISNGVRILESKSITPKVFFAPAHTFDNNTVTALLECSSIRIISDTIANKPYNRNGMTYIPQQAGNVRLLPFHTVTFCCHPNTMSESEFYRLSDFIRKYRRLFSDYQAEESRRAFDVYDRLLSFLYFIRRS